MTAELNGSIPANHQYWWQSTGQNLADMLRAADYSEDAQYEFLSFYRDHICPELGNSPEVDSVKSIITYDGTPIEYSYSFSGTLGHPTVRFVADLSPLRPLNATDPFKTDGMRRAIDAFLERSNQADATWYYALKEYLELKSSASKVRDIIAQTGHQSPVMLGFDISRGEADGSPPNLGTGKIYFLPCFAAAERGMTRWQVISQAVKQLPEVASLPNILSSLALIDDYLASKPKDWQQGARFISIDLLHPSKSRIKVYLRCPGTSFDDMWDFYTLGGKLDASLDDKAKFQQLFRLIMGCRDGDPDPNPFNSPFFSLNSETRMTSVQHKLTTMYFSFSADHPVPVPKLNFCPRVFGADDAVVTKGLSQWFKEQSWDEVSATSYESLVGNIL